MGQHRDKYAEDDADGEPRNREANRLARVKADELVLIVRFEIKKNQAGDEAQQVCQRRNYVGLRFSALTVHREFLLLISNDDPGSDPWLLICSRTHQGIAMRTRAARALRHDGLLESCPRPLNRARQPAYCDRLFRTASRRSIAAVALRAVSTTSSCARTRLASWRRNTGLARKSLTPRRIPSARASKSSRAVIMMIGISAVSGLSLSAFTTSKPSISGIIRSSRITSTSFS